MRRWVAVMFVLVSTGLGVLAHDFYSTKITWSAEVSRVVYRRCASCHHAGGTAFSLMSYQEARPWAEAIKQQVLARRMPPWNAVKGFGEFRQDRGLTQEDIAILAEWVEGGAPEGNSLYLPAPPDFHAGATANQGFNSNHARERRIEFSGTMMAKRGLNVLGIEPRQAPGAGAIQVIARRPDGSIEPLIWVERFSPGYNEVYYFRRSLHFRAGTKIEITPPEGGAALVVEGP